MNSCKNHNTYINCKPNGRKSKFGLKLWFRILWVTLKHNEPFCKKSCWLETEKISTELSSWIWYPLWRASLITYMLYKMDDYFVADYNGQPHLFIPASYHLEHIMVWSWRFMSNLQINQRLNLLLIGSFIYIFEALW